MQTNGSSVEHIPVLAETLAEQISIPPDGVMVDTTIGHGGHACLFGKILGPHGTIIGLDVDNKALQKAESRLIGLACKCILVHSNFSQVGTVLQDLGITATDLVLADLGLCSAQVADSEFGLSFQTDMPLDMRIDKRLKTTAADIVNGANEESLADLIYKYGQDMASRRIARFIVEQRRRKPIATTCQLAALVCRALSAGRRRAWTATHPATRTFQALRIAVNNELDNLQRLLDQVPRLLRTTGYVAIISYHSLEDRLVKDDFRRNERQGLYRVITRKPIMPGQKEIKDNRRARSAKLRIAQKR